MNIYTALILLLLTATLSSASITRIDVLKLPDINAWEKQVFSGVTSYELHEIDGRQVLKAISKQSASGLVREIEVDLTKTPYMNWSWKVDSILSDVEETKKSGDDYAARVYVVISDGFFFWQTRALSYVWASKQAKGSSWPNAFTGKATMVAVESGEDSVGEWVEEKRNVLDDINNLLGIDATRIDAVAIMTDTDNSRQSATAYYGDIFFTSE
ncbi:MAG: DUF3047 domain-containing protein [Thiogranum sp.]